MLDVTNLHIKADACGGPVTLRSFAYLRISTDIERSEFAIYGDPIQISPRDPCWQSRCSANASKNTT
jgi:hypothetical protein